MAEEQRRAKLKDQAKAAERFLVLRNFEEADRISRYVLQQAQYVPDSSPEQQRAAFVFLQALFELNRYITGFQCLIGSDDGVGLPNVRVSHLLPRFGESFAALEQHCGGLAGVDFDVMMLW
jgi:hypothetical protein